MKIKIKRNSQYSFGFAAILIASEKFLYLVNYSLLGEIFVLFTLAWSGYVMYKLKRYPNPNYRFGVIIGFSVMLVLMSSLQSYLLYNQSIFMGIRPQRFWLSWAIVYFPLRKLTYNNKITQEDIVRLIYWVCTIELFL